MGRRAGCVNSSIVQWPLLRNLLGLSFGQATLAWQRSDGFVMNTISLQVLTVYGIAWIIAGAATGMAEFNIHALDDVIHGRIRLG